MADRTREVGGVAGAIVVVIIVLAALLLPRGQQVALDQRLSTYRTTPDGAQALYETLDAVGVRVSRRLTPFVDADSLAGPLAVLAPAEPPTPAEVRRLVAWVDSGGSLVLAAPLLGSLSGAFGLRVTFAQAPSPAQAASGQVWFGGAPVDATPRGHEWTRGLRAPIPVRRVFVDSGAVKDASVLLATAKGDAPVVVWFRRGRGGVLAIADPSLLSNTELRGSDLAPLVARAALAMGGAGDTLRFDEYHHGHHGGSVARGLAAFLADHPLGHAAIQLLAVGLLALLVVGRRFGAPRPPRPKRRRSPLEHVVALGEVYRQARARELTRRRLLGGFARRIRRERPRPGQEAAFLDRLRTSVPTGAAAVAALEAAWHDEDTELVELSARIDQAVDELGR